MSRTRNTVAFTLAALLFAGSPLAVIARAADDATKKEHKEGEPETELQKQMEIIEKGMKKLRKSVKKADENADSLATIATIKKAATASRELIPAMASTIPEADRAKFKESYQKDMDHFISVVDKLGAAVKDNKNDDAADVLKQLKELEDAGHEKFTK